MKSTPTITPNLIAGEWYHVMDTMSSSVVGDFYRAWIRVDRLIRASSFDDQYIRYSESVNGFRYIESYSSEMSINVPGRIVSPATDAQKMLIKNSMNSEPFNI